MIFDYKSPTDFKYAGMFAGQNQWLIGHYQGNWNNRVAQVDWDDLGRAIEIGLSYSLEVQLNGNDVRLIADGETVLSATFDSDVTGGSVGLATQNGSTAFNNFLVEATPTDPLLVDALFSAWGESSLV
ncbi:MAG: hypothetical protein R3C11_21945 [Planctomycetaceae bacterium]